jgi:hypothetical protein
MADAVDEVVVSVTWKLRTLLRTKRFYSTAGMLVLYKSHVLPFIEYRTAAIYHARRDVRERLDRVQDKFLEDVGISSQDALLQFNLAPLASRRVIAMLGLIHRAVLRQARALLAVLPRSRHSWWKTASFHLGGLAFSAGCSFQLAVQISAWTDTSVQHAAGCSR